MPLTDRFLTLFQRLLTYPWWEVAVELVLIWIVVFAILRFVQGTRAAGALKVITLVLLSATLAFRVFGGDDLFGRLSYLYDRLLALVAVALVVIFQPELRRGLIRLGEARLLGGGTRAKAEAIEPIVTAAAYLAKQRMGAIMVIERDAGLRGLVEGGTDLDAMLSARLLQTIFFPGSALHDLAVVIRGSKVVAAGVQLPLADPSEMPDPSLGSRHRAAVGLTKECDAIVLVVSEETGMMRLAERGRLSRPFEPDALVEQLRRRLGVGSPEPADAGDEAPGKRPGAAATPGTGAGAASALDADDTVLSLSGDAPEDDVKARPAGGDPGKTERSHEAG
ncbi:MAG: diadenylate cyclase [Planctomycetota bacterium]